MEEFTREELQNIRERAIQCTNDVKNIHWIGAYGDLAAAADKLDAMEARAEDKN